MVTSPRSRSRVSQAFHRLSFVLGMGVTLWVALGYIATKMKDARIKMLRERQKNDRVKQHFTSTMSNITFTVYALLPTLSTQILQDINVEGLTEELQQLAGKTKASVTAAPTEGELTSQASSQILESDFKTDSTDSSSAKGIGESWASEFVAQTNEAGSNTGDSLSTVSEAEAEHGEHPISPSHPVADLLLSTPSSQPYALTDMSTSVSNFTEESQSPERRSSFGGKEPSSPESRYLRSPSRSPSMPTDRKRLFSTNDDGKEHQGDNTAEGHSTYAQILKSGIPEGQVEEQEAARYRAQVEALHQPPKRSKAQLWGEIKVQAVTRTVLAIYLVPLLAIQTVSQLTLLARLHHLQSQAAMAAEQEDEKAESIPKLPSSTIRSATTTVKQLMSPWKYFSLEAMGLDDIALETEAQQKSLAESIVSGAWSMGTNTASYLLGSKVVPKSKGKQREPTPSLYEIVDPDSERIFLCFSWWLLHVGWRELHEVVQTVVKQKLKGVGLKKELTVQDWVRLVDDIKRSVEEQIGEEDGVSGFHDLIFPPADPSEFSRLLEKHNLVEDCPILPPPYTSPLSDLLNQSSSHISSPDFDYLFPLCVNRLRNDALDNLAVEIYDEIALISSQTLEENAGLDEDDKRKRLVDCLPFLTTWSRNLWATVPDEAIERMLGLNEFEAFATLIYADFGNGLNDIGTP